MKINFSPDGKVNLPMMVLAYHSGKLIKPLLVSECHFSDDMEDISKFTFSVNKNTCDIWEKVRDFRLLYIPEDDDYYCISVNLNESTGLTKAITAIHYPEYELSKVKLYNVEVNTEDEIDTFEDYKPTVLYNKEDSSHSLIDRILNKVSNFQIKHVDESIASIQRVFSWNDTSIYNAIQDISEEINCLFVFKCHRNNNRSIVKEIYVYDLEQYCNDCGYRDDFDGDVCPKCGSKNILPGYGMNTDIFLSIDNFIDDNSYSTNIEDIANCFNLSAGDDLMTDVIKACNPNGSSYIWRISNFFQEDMSDELKQKLYEYSNIYNKYVDKNYGSDFNVGDSVCSIDVTDFNNLVDQYFATVDPDTANFYVEKIDNIQGYKGLINALYNANDMEYYLTDTLLPIIDNDPNNVSASSQINLLTHTSLSPVSVADLKSISVSTANTAITNMAKVLIDSRYKISIVNGNIQKNTENNTITSCIWTGQITLTNYSDDEDTATSETISVDINDDYDNFVKQKIDKLLKKGDAEDYSISTLFKKDLDEFKKSLKQYSSKYLENLHNSCQGCIDILIQQGVADPTTWENNNKTLYPNLYVPYKEKLAAIEEEQSIRESEISIVVNMIDSIENIRDKIQALLNFQKFVGNDLWNELQTFRIDSTYSNENYISDGLTNSELFKKANEFFDAANKAIKKSSELEHNIDTTLKHLLSIKECRPLLENFELGNWLHLQVDDDVYKLRLKSYEFDFENSDTMNVTFSNATITHSRMQDLQAAIQNINGISPSYNSTKKKAEKSVGTKDTVDKWLSSGLDMTLTKIVNSAENQDVVYDEHGLLFRRYDDINEQYDETQSKIINSSYVLTTDNWKTVKTAIGELYYLDPIDNTIKKGYGINADILIGRLLIGENLIISNKKGSLLFNDSGFKVTTSGGQMSLGEDGFNLSNTNQITIDNGNLKIQNGNLVLTGDITATNINATMSGIIGCWKINSQRMYDDTGTVYTGVNKNGSGMAFWAGGTDLTGNTAPFRVNHSGKLVATDVDITGNIVATSATLNNAIVKDVLCMTNTGEDITFPVLKSIKNSDYFQLYIGSKDMLDDVSILSDRFCNIETNVQITLASELIKMKADVDLDKSITVTGQLRCVDAFNNTSTGTANARLCNIPDGRSDSRLARIASSSKRYKNVLSNLSENDIEALYDIQTYWFTYKDNYLNSDDERYHKHIPGFIVEDWDKVMPIAIDHRNDGKPEMWNQNIIIPLMFEMIKTEHKNNEDLKRRIKLLEGE